MFSPFDLLVLSSVNALAPNRLRALVEHCSGPAGALQASSDEIASVPGFSERIAAEVWKTLHDPSGEPSRFAEGQLRAIDRAGAALLTWWDLGYPDLLRRIYDPPALLYVRGELEPEDRFALALVGTRAASEYGRASAERFSRACAHAGLTVVSGLARGVDTAAHRSALAAEGRTIAVIGSGLDRLYPPENAPLAGEIAARGAVLCEYPMGARPEARNFPRRNRIISGLCLGTLVIESDLAGGAMITARLALDQNREVFALPGPALVRTSLGCNALIRDGRAKLVEHLGDILAELTPALAPVLRRKEASNPVPEEPSLFDPDRPA